MCLEAPPRIPLGPWKAKKPPVLELEKVSDVGELPETATIPKPSKKRQNIKKITIVGLILIGILALSMFTIFILRYQPTTEETFDILEEIAKLRTNYGEKYSVEEYDWKVWSKQFEASGGTLVEMENWDEFKESLRQNLYVDFLMLDEENKVIWYRPASAIVVYLHY